MLIQAPLPILGQTERIPFLSKIQDFRPPVKTHVQADTVYDRCKLYSTPFVLHNS